MNKPALVVEYVVTADGFDGEPWPPNAAGPWVVVARARPSGDASAQTSIFPSPMCCLSDGTNKGDESCKTCKTRT
jgi:hypothetical protein